jgi:flagellar assembly protein FliH
MDPVIRAAPLAPVRARLSEVGATRAMVDAQALERATRAALRAEIERQVRAELEPQLQELRNVERERSQSQGYEAGLAAAKAEVREELRTTTEALSHRVHGILAALTRAHEDTTSRSAASVGEVAFTALARLIGEQAATRTFVSALVEQTCAHVRDQSIVAVRMHPRDIALLRELADGSEPALHSLGVAIEPDDALELGGCVVQTAAGCFDASLETQLRRLHGAMTQSIANGRA